MRGVYVKSVRRTVSLKYYFSGKYLTIYHFLFPYRAIISYSKQKGLFQFVKGATVGNSRIQNTYSQIITKEIKKKKKVTHAINIYL